MADDSSSSLDYRAALIGGLAAIAGGLITGIFTCQGTVETQRAENRRTDERIATAAKGAARELIAELVAAGSYGTIAFAENRFPSPSRAFRKAFEIRVSPSDRKLINGQLSPQQYQFVGSAITDAGSLETGVQTLAQPFSKAGKHALRLRIIGFSAAIIALADVADIEGTSLIEEHRRVVRTGQP